MKNCCIVLNTKSADRRVAELAEICKKKDITVCDFTEAQPIEFDTCIAFLEPRAQVTANVFAHLPIGSHVFGYAPEFDKTLLEPKQFKYTCLSSDEDFITENNYLTALALREIITKRFGKANQKMLLLGYGKLTKQLEKVFDTADIHILNFNESKKAPLRATYGEKAYFENAPLADFSIIINTIPRQLITEKHLKKIKPKCRKQVTIYDLASPPYGFDFGNLDKTEFDYNIEPALPGRFFSRKAAQAVFDTMRKIVCELRITIALCITGSPCSYEKLLPIIESLCKSYNIVPVLTENACSPNRFVDIEEFKDTIHDLTGANLVTTIAGAETLSARPEIVAAVVLPATGNTIAKFANVVTDTPVTMAVKALLRNNKPCVIGLSTNDALSGNAANIGVLLNRKNYFFVPFGQDNPIAKPFSMICDFNKTAETIESAIVGKQLQPILI